MAYTSRVGLGSPHLDFRPQWAPPRRMDSEDIVTVQTMSGEAAARNFSTSSTDSVKSDQSFRSGRSSRIASPGKTGSLLNQATGLPSPPRSNSDIALPTIPDSSLMNESPPASLIESRQYQLAGRNVSATSSASGSGLSEKSRDPRRPISRGTDTRMSRTNSSSSAVTAPSLHSDGPPSDQRVRPSFSPSTPRKPSPSARASSDRSSHHSSRQSRRIPSDRRSSTSSRSSRHDDSIPVAAGSSSLSPSPASIRAAESYSSARTAASPSPSPNALSPSRMSNGMGRSSSRQSHTSQTRPARAKSPHLYPPSAPSPSSPTPSLPRRESLHKESPRVASPLPQEVRSHERPTSKRYDSGTELDGRIKEAEDKIRLTARRPRNYASTSPTKVTLHRHDSYSRLSGSRRDLYAQSRDDPAAKADSPPALEPSTKTFTRARASKVSRQLAEEQSLPPISRTSISPDATFANRTQETSTLRRGTSVAQQVNSGLETLRRSATVSSAASLARTPGGTDRDYREEEQDRSGGSGGSRARKPLPTSFRQNHNSLFTPSPKQSITDPYTNAHISPTGRFHTTSRLSREPSLPSPSSPRHRLIDGLERSSSVSSRLDRRNWADSLTGLPKRYEGMFDDPNSLSRRPGRSQQDRPRAESVMEGAYANQRYTRDRDLAPRLSRLSIAPSDSVSAVGDSRRTPTSTKDPLDVLRRIEAQRNEHNKQWDAERSASVLGDLPAPRSGTGSQIHISPQRIRPATSMSGLRDTYVAPRTAPLDRVRRSGDDFRSPRSSQLNHSPSRLSQLGGPSSEPRPMRSSSSLGGRTSTNLDALSASSEHGRLLYEAARAFELKIPPDVLPQVPDIGSSIVGAARSAETSNAAIRSVVQMASQLIVAAELDDSSDHLLRDFKTLVLGLRDTGRASDQNVRDLTRLMLDVPKLLRVDPNANMSRLPTSSTSGSIRAPAHVNGTPVKSIPRRYVPSPYESPIRRSEELPRSSTSVGDVMSPERRRQRESLPSNFGLEGNGDGRSGRGLLSRMRNLGRNREGLDSIEDSPPKAFTERIAEVPPSPARRMLRKKASSTSTHTVRGNSFLPSASKPTAAISTVTASESPRDSKFDTYSSQAVLAGRGDAGEWDFRGARSGGQADGGGSSLNSRSGSFHTAAEGSPDRGDGDESGEEARRGGSGDDETLSSLADAQRRREEEAVSAGSGLLGKTGLTRSSSMVSKASSGGRKWSVTDRFKATLGRKG